MRLVEEIHDFTLSASLFGVFGIIKLDHILQKGVPVSNYLSVSSLTKYLKLKFDKDPIWKGFI